MKSRVCACGLTAFAKVGKWGVAIVDFQDRHVFSRFWHITGENRLTSYARSFFRIGRGKRIGKRLHNFVIGKSGKEYPLDHKNGNGLDCRRSNLRAAAQAKNNQNTKPRRQSSSRFLGVSFIAGGQRRARWQAQLQLAGVKYRLGFFHFEQDAAIAYNYAAAHLFGDFARLNRVITFHHE